MEPQQSRGTKATGAVLVGVARTAILACGQLLYVLVRLGASGQGRPSLSFGQPGGRIISLSEAAPVKRTKVVFEHMAPIGE